MPERIDPTLRPKRKEYIITETAVRMRDGRKDLAEGDKIQVSDAQVGMRLVDPSGERSAGRKDLRVRKVVEGPRLPSGRRERYYVMESSDGN